MTGQVAAACGRCGGDGWVLRVGPRGFIGGTPCVDCRCAGCGRPSAGRLCPTCEANDFVRADMVFRRAADQ